jgi:isoleucyl-tRNA synthetase
MYTMADGLARLLAPILPVTSDELWHHIPGAREESVHLAEFPQLNELQGLRDPWLEKRWESLVEVRGVVNIKLEEQRTKKEIGSSLQAAVTLDVDHIPTAALLRRHLSDLPMLLIVSEVKLSEQVAKGPAFSDVELHAALSEGGQRSFDTVSVSRADGVKCERCWRIVPKVSTQPATVGLCDRCIDALPAGGPSTGLGAGGGREVA